MKETNKKEIEAYDSIEKSLQRIAESLENIAGELREKRING